MFEAIARRSNQNILRRKRRFPSTWVPFRSVVFDSRCWCRLAVFDRLADLEAGSWRRIVYDCAPKSDGHDRLTVESGRARQIELPRCPTPQRPRGSRSVVLVLSIGGPRIRGATEEYFLPRLCLCVHQKRFLSLCRFGIEQSPGCRSTSERAPGPRPRSGRTSGRERVRENSPGAAHSFEVSRSDKLLPSGRPRCPREIFVRVRFRQLLDDLLSGQLGGISHTHPR